MGRNVQRHAQHGVLELVGAGADPAELIDHVEKEEQRQKRQGDKAYGRGNVAVDHLAEGFHARAPLLRSHCSGERWWLRK
ncbi:hypothetical protein D3C72_1209430 [compost metagenome]